VLNSYYGQHSGVIGLTKGELYKTTSENETASYGYDKVTIALLRIHLA